MRPLYRSIAETNMQMHVSKQRWLSSNKTGSSRHQAVIKRDCSTALNARRRQPISVKAFKESSEAVMLPMDVYRVRAADVHDIFTSMHQLQTLCPCIQNLMLSVYRIPQRCRFWESTGQPAGRHASRHQRSSWEVFQMWDTVRT